MLETNHPLAVAAITGYMNAVTIGLFGFGYYGLLGGMVGAVFVLIITPVATPPESRLAILAKVLLSAFVGALVGTLVASVAVHYFDVLKPLANAVIVLASLVMGVVGWPVVMLAAKLVLAYVPKLAGLLPGNGRADGGQP
jgi:Na+/phosphate symporter